MTNSRFSGTQKTKQNIEAGISQAQTVILLVGLLVAVFGNSIATGANPDASAGASPHFSRREIPYKPKKLNFEPGCPSLNIFFFFSWSQQR